MLTTLYKKQAKKSRKEGNDMLILEIANVILTAAIVILLIKEVRK